MKSREIVFCGSAHKELLKLSKSKAAAQIGQAVIKLLSPEEFKTAEKKVVGQHGLRSLRCGEYRFVFRERKRHVLVLSVSKRNDLDAYRKAIRRSENRGSSSIRETTRRGGGTT